jgi:hypothetical protein
LSADAKPGPRRAVRRLAAAAAWASLGLLALGAAVFAATTVNLNPFRSVGEELDRFEGVSVYFNGGIRRSGQRRLTPDGYNLGFEFQCVEFVKRFYDQRLNHRMPDTYGHAKSFFDPALTDGRFNAKRGLTQHANPGASTPRPLDLIVFDAWLLNPYGHVAIVTRVDEVQGRLEIIQQNPGPFGASRESLTLRKLGNGAWQVGDGGSRVMGWLRVPVSP